MYPTLRLCLAFVLITTATLAAFFGAEWWQVVPPGAIALRWIERDDHIETVKQFPKKDPTRLLAISIGVQYLHATGTISVAWLLGLIIAWWNG